MIDQLSKDKKFSKVYFLINRLRDKGYEAFIVGGGVRDILHSTIPDDYDIITNALPKQIKEIFFDQKLKIIGTGFQVCLIDNIEIATYQVHRYIESDTTFFTKDLQEDLLHRDFTMNSMAMCPFTGEIKDPANGIGDLKNKIIRFTGSALNRIKEDPCRIIRACRFKAKIQGEFDKDTFKSLQLFSHLVKDFVAPERIRLEILKALKYEKPSLFFQAMHDIGILDYILPGLDLCFNFHGGQYHSETICQHSLMAGDFITPKNILLRFTGYLHDIGKPVTANIKNNKMSFINHDKLGALMIKHDLRRLKFSNEEIDYISSLSYHHMRDIKSSSTPKAVRKMLLTFRKDKIDYMDWLRLKIADQKANLAKSNIKLSEIKNILRKIKNELNPFNPKAFSINDLAVSGYDVMNILNINQGPKVGIIMNKLLDLVIETPNLNTRNNLIQIIETMKD